jgi:hypothetical protein
MSIKCRNYIDGGVEMGSVFDVESIIPRSSGLINCIFITCVWGASEVLNSNAIDDVIIG